MGAFDYHRRHSSEVMVGGVALGGDNPVRVQSMTNTSTMDTAGSVEQCERIARAGADIVRLTAQGVRESANLSLIRDELRRRGIDIPLVADIHFNPKAAFDAAARVEKVRVNPGNFVDPGRVFKKIDYTDAEYADELARIDRVFGEFLDICREHGTAVRLGVNHGSLSDRIMSRYGDTPAGMVESAMEFLRVARRRRFDSIVISIKASNVAVMVETVRLLVKAMDAEDMHFPLHLGVTEAGDGEDGRVKSAVGIGTLMAEGIGDTIRVSLSEAPEAEVPVARILTDYFGSLADAPAVEADPFDFPAPAKALVVGTDAVADYDPDRRPDFFAGDRDVTVADTAAAHTMDFGDGHTVVLTSRHPAFIADVSACAARLRRSGVTNPIVACARFRGVDKETVTVLAAAQLGTLVMNGRVDGVMVDADTLTPAQQASLAFGILQAARRRVTRTEYIACPGCGRTLFDLQQTLRRVKETTAGLKGLKIGVMGCIVNGPGEMADADYGYVGAAAGHVSLYRGKECVRRNIPQDEALGALLDLLRADGHEI